PAAGACPALARFAKACREAVDPGRLHQLALSLGLSVTSLSRFGVGWSAGHAAWTFPMVDHTGTVLGMRLRLPDGRKLSVRGGKEGLFLPRDFAAQSPVLIAEGPTDAAALLDLGFPAALGRPSCTA